MSVPRSLCSALAALLLGWPAAHAASFTPGNLVIYRVGDGAAALANTGNAVFLDEYTPAGFLVQSIALPTTASGANHALIASGVATSEGLLNLSPNGQFLTFTGYDASLGGSAPLATSTGPRTIGIVGRDGVVDTTTSLNNFADGNNPRSAVTDNGVNLWAAGGAGGVLYATKGAAFGTVLNSTLPNFRNITIAGGQLYVSSGADTVRLGTVGLGTPKTGVQSIDTLPGMPTTGVTYDQFIFADLSLQVAGLDTLYVANENTTGGIQKYGLINGIWTFEGTNAPDANGERFRGLAGRVVNGVVTLYATSQGASQTSGRLVSLTDASGWDGSLTGTVTELATAANGETFRGVAFVPVPEPASLATLALGLATLASTRRARRPAAATSAC